MAQLISTGPGTFRYVDDQQPQVDRQWTQRGAPRELPPLPPSMPDVGPVTQLKRDVAVGHDLTPSASQILYDTPTRYYVTPDYQEGVQRYFGGGEQGKYQQGVEPNIRVLGYAPPRTPEERQNPIYAGMPGQGVMGHEFGHKWYYEQLPEEVRQDWARDRNYAKVEFPRSPSLWSQFPDTTGEPNSTFPSEAYARTQQYGDTLQPMPAWIKERYYPGLFNLPERPWSKYDSTPIAPPQIMSDRLRDPYEYAPETRQPETPSLYQAPSWMYPERIPNYQGYQG